MNIIVKKITKEDNLETVDELLLEAFNVKRLGEFDCNNIEIVAVNDSIVLGYLVLNKLYDNIKNINYAYLNYFCVKQAYQNNNIGSLMLEKAFKIAKENNISYIELTSKSERKIAHHLYKKYEFMIRNTVVFRKEIK